jgi:diguanylate cyclase
VTCLVFTLTLTRMVLLAAYSSRQRKLLRDKNGKLAESLAKVEKMAITDDLTGVFNRGWMVTALTHECQRAQRHGGTFMVAMLDIDLFKQINDRFGHLSGDQVLKQFAQIVKGELRKTDFLARVGGEEFLVLLPETPHHGGLLVLERIRRKVAEHPWAELQAGLEVTVSIGAACFLDDDLPDALWGRDDVALYDAKSSGRNCVRPCRSVSLTEVAA